MDKEKLLKPFEFFGVEFEREEGQESIGNCPFEDCNKEEHFFVNRGTGQWDCKVCTRSGNVYTFLKQIVEFYNEATTDKEWTLLAKKRRLPVDALQAWGLGYTGSIWLIPVTNAKGAVIDLRRYSLRGKSGVRSTPGMKVGLFGMDELARSPKEARVWLCEGEWDGMGLNWVLASLGMDDVVVAVPGAGTFKKEWIDFFKGREVVIAYDHDRAGAEGSDKVIKSLSGTARTISRLDWPSTRKEGFDVSDAIAEARQIPDRALRSLERLVVKVKGGGGGSRNAATGQGNGHSVEVSEEGREAPYDPVEVGSIPEKDLPSFESTLDIYKRRISMGEDMVDCLRVIYGHALSIDLPGDPLWTYIVAPPGAGKTLLLMSMAGSQRCLYRSRMTPQSLCSGFKGGDPSQLPTFDQKCVVLKDFTEFLSCPEAVQSTIYATLRGAYDGHVYSTFGNGVVREYWLKFSLLAGVTPVIHANREASLGERFLKFQMFKGTDWDPEEEILAAMDNVFDKGDMEKEIAEAAGAFLSRSLIDAPRPSIPEWVRRKILALSQLIAAARTDVPREQFRDDRIMHRTSPEMGTRLAGQLIKLAVVIGKVDGVSEIGEYTYDLIQRVGLDTAYGFNFDIIKVLYDKGGAASMLELSEQTRIPSTTIGRRLEDLQFLQIVTKNRSRNKGKPGRPGLQYHLSDKYTKLWEESGLKDVEFSE